MNRQRYEDETYEQYRKALNTEEKQKRQYLKGTVSWCSAAMKPGIVPGTFNKVVVQGTYKKPRTV